MTTERALAEPEAIPRPHVSVLVPTLDEVGNVDELFTRVFAHAHASRLDIEVVVIDDGSRDGTRERVRAWGESHRVRLVARDGERGLAGAVLAGAEVAVGHVVVVIDADLSHPPETIADLVGPILDGSRDLVIGSRYVSGGGTRGWPLARQVSSRAAALLAWPLTDARDPLAGFFALSRVRLLETGRRAEGFKIGLEVLLRGGEELRVAEVPITFSERTSGSSKLGARVVGAYVRQLVGLAGGQLPRGSAVRFGLAALAASGLDLLAFALLTRAGVGLGAAHLASFLCYALIGFASLDGLAGSVRRSPLALAAWRRHLRFAAIALMTVFLRGGVLALLVERLGWSPGTAILPAVAATALVGGLGLVFVVLPVGGGEEGAERRWRAAAVGILAYAFVLRLVYLGQVQLLPEEAYYWNYAQHLDIGYLDHPPMVAWLIAAGTALFGHNEFAVRIGALCCWLTTAAFTYGLCKNVAGRTTALHATLLLGVLPFFFGIGCFMTPDAPVVACWAACLYFLERALLGGRAGAWIAAGVGLGLGMLSKYPIALLVPASLLFLLLDPRSRAWLKRPQPWIGLAVAAALFSPVLVWNARHDWASFVYQGPTRWQTTAGFSLHGLVGSVLVMLTPLGLLGFVVGLRRRAARHGPGEADRTLRFSLVFTFVPLAVFTLASFASETKLQWTGPLWLAALPVIATTLIPRRGPIERPRAFEITRLWKPAMLALLVGYGAVLHLPVLGLPGVRTPATNFTNGWRELGREVEAIEHAVARQTGEEPLIVGMDKYNLASLVAFYDPDRDGAGETTGRHLFGKQSLMYAFWLQPRDGEGKNLVLLADEPEDLTSEAVVARADRLDPVQEIDVESLSANPVRYFVRVAYGYHSEPVLR